MSPKVIQGQWPQTVSDDPDIWWVIYGAVEDAELEYGVHFALNNHYEAHTRKKTATCNDYIHKLTSKMLRKLPL